MLLTKLLCLLLITNVLGDPNPKADPKPDPKAEPKAQANHNAIFPPGFGHPGPDFGHPNPGFRLGGSPLEGSSSAVGDHSHCALLIPGHGKSSHFGHTLDVFNGIHSPPHGGADDTYTCITFQSIDAAFISARDKYGLPRPKMPITTPQMANLGRILVQTTRIIAKQYSLPKDVIINGLPLVDSLKSIIGTICLDFIKVVECKPSKYRRYDGLCNNLQHPHWGSAFSTFRRRIGPDYADGIDKPRRSKSGGPLPSARAISAHLHRDEGLHDHAVTIMCVAWGQAIDHDMTFTGETKLPGSKKDPKCCDKDSGFPECFPIRVSHKDAFFALFKQNCMSMVRSAPGVPYGCKLGPRSQINEISSYIDANFIYGSHKSTVDRLRLFKGGLLKSLPVFREFGMKDLLPLKLHEPEDGCIRPNNDLYCFDAGDGRVNEQLVLAVIHTLLMREHNKLATGLSNINPHWDDERLYQESRHIIAAEIQHITYNEFLPMVLGKEVMQKFELLLEKHGYFDGYNPKMDVTMTADFTTSAFRFGHSLLPSTIERWSAGHKYIASQRLSGMLRQPYDLYKGGWCDQFTMGLCNQVAQAMDDSVTQEVTNHLFQEPKKKFGMDLAAINMQRGREHGVPSYNKFRRFCGLHTIKSWHELEGIMSNKTVKRYSDVYKHPEDIDLWTGGVSERPLPGAMVGPTFSCLIALTFKELRYGDRFWYENGGFKSSFTPGQLEEIRKVKLSRIICDNTDDIKTIQVYAMVLPDHDINPRVPCASGILPKMDLNKWREPHRRPHSLHHGPSHVINRHPIHSQTNSSSELSTTEAIPAETESHFTNPSTQTDGPPLKEYSPSRAPAILANLDLPDNPLELRFISQSLNDTTDIPADVSNFHDIQSVSHHNTHDNTKSNHSLHDGQAYIPNKHDDQSYVHDKDHIQSYVHDKEHIQSYVHDKDHTQSYVNDKDDIQSSDPHYIKSFHRPGYSEAKNLKSTKHAPVHAGFGPLMEKSKIERHPKIIKPSPPFASGPSKTLGRSKANFKPSKFYIRRAKSLPSDCNCGPHFKPTHHSKFYTARDNRKSRLHRHRILYGYQPKKRKWSKDHHN